MSAAHVSAAAVEAGHANLAAAPPSGLGHLAAAPPSGLGSVATVREADADASAAATPCRSPIAAWSGRALEPQEPGPAEGGSKRPRPTSCVPRALRKARVSVKVVGVGAMLLVLLISLIGAPESLISDDVTHRRVISVLFLVGLFLVAVEDVVGINKSAVMLILSAAMWVFTAASLHPTVSRKGREEFHKHLDKGLEDVGGIVLFLLPAMGVVESIDHFGGFNVVTDMIQRVIGSKRGRLLPIICMLSFFMSSVIDNLTATIVALKILRHVVPSDDNFRQLCGGLAVIAANAGGAWSPIGDVTTTMLWIQNKITVTKTVASLFLPSFVAGVVPLAGIWWQARVDAMRLAAKAGDVAGNDEQDSTGAAVVTRSNVLVLILGICCIIMVPVLKMWTGLPPYLGMLFALGVVWIVTEAMDFSTPEEELSSEDSSDDRELDVERSTYIVEVKPKQHVVAVHGGVPEALHKVDLTGLLFFTGVLLAVVALDSAGVLKRYAMWMKESFNDNAVVLCSVLGVSSAVVDNVPLVEASIEMFEKPADDPLWQLVALAAGTGGSILSIGSIAGVTFMSMEGVGFLWYVRKVGLWAALGFAMGIATYEGQRRLTGI